MALGKQIALKRMTDDKGIFRMTSLDQLPPIRDPLRPRLAQEANLDEEVIRFKRMVLETFQDKMTAMLLDPAFALAGCHDALNRDTGLFLSLEDPYSLKSGDGATWTNPIANWSVGKAKRIGAQAVKLLIWYRPDGDPDIKDHQENLVKEVGEQCRLYDIPFILELLAYSGGEGAMGLAPTVLGSVEEFTKPHYQVDAFLVESPVAAQDLPEFASADAGAALETFKKLGQLAGRPWIMMSMGADMQQFHHVMQFAYKAGCAGYLAGRAYWQDALAQYPDWQSVETTMQLAVQSHIDPLNLLTDDLANPGYLLSRDSAHSPTGDVFCKMYQDI